MKRRFLDFGIGIDIPLAAATETFAIVAKRRVGKSNTAVVMAEAFYGVEIPFCAVDPKGDWYGVRADGPRLKGLNVVIFGGRHADLPLEYTEGAFIAELVAKRRISCVLDVSQFSDLEKSRFLTDFANALLRLNTDPVHLFLEEADDYLPQVLRFKEQGRCVAAFQKLVRQGGFRGIGVTAITHRCPALDKGILNQSETLIVHRTKAPKDKKTVGEWFEKTGEEGKEILKTLSKLANGEAWIVSHFLELDEPRRVQFPRRGTFDSGATPEVGGRRRKAATLTVVDIDALRERMKEAIERAKAEDPKELQKRIRELETERASAQARVVQAQPYAPPSIDVATLKKQLAQRSRTIEVPMFSKAASKDLLIAINKVNLSVARAASIRITDVGERMNQDAKRLEEVIEKFMAKLREDRQPVLPTREPFPLAIVPSETSRKKGRFDIVPVTGPLPEGARSATPSKANGKPLPKGAREILRQLVAMKRPLSLAEVAALSGIPPKGSTFRTYRSLLRTKGYVEEQADGRLAVTGPGFAIVGPVPGPKTAKELYDHWARKLPKGARDMLWILMDVYPQPLAREELGRRTNTDPAKSTYRTYMSLLRRRGLAETEGDTVSASATLFEGGR